MNSAVLALNSIMTSIQIFWCVKKIDGGSILCVKSLSAQSGGQSFWPKHAGRFIIEFLLKTSPWVDSNMSRSGSQPCLVNRPFHRFLLPTQTMNWLTSKVKSLFRLVKMSNIFFFSHSTDSRKRTKYFLGVFPNMFTCRVVHLINGFVLLLSLFNSCYIHAFSHTKRLIE